MGQSQWDYDKLKDCFTRSEKSLNRDEDHRGKDRPWLNGTLSDYASRVLRPMTRTAEHHAHNVPSISLAAFDIATDQHMRRSSLFSVYLPSDLLRSRPNLNISANTIATRIVFDAGTQKLRVNGARRKVVLCCGALATPQPPMLSGIGPEDHLKKHGVKTVVHSFGVGSNLRSLFSSPFVHTVIFLPTCLLSSVGTIMPYGASDLDISKPENVPDIQIKLIPVSGIDGPSEVTSGVCTFMVCLLRPKSVGSVRLARADSCE
ncbi:GMC oxidoreductase [Sphaerobolus stellatus SS14]|uniref:GMC oxidoreductase n=1 Tax=Sphaerobolus stellatus (strain SS14) TaxID=990650 RepID=A0A0C9TFB5_SPHS4|nr:GMC oxidoreductase [Sphaerobolus stellatus SS14]